MTRYELSENTRIPDNGQLTEILNSLEISDYIRRESFFGYKKRNTRYLLAEYYSLFDFNFIQDLHENEKTLQTAMITTYGVKQNLYSNMVNCQVVLDDLFQ